jgi:hypothetical protein
MSLMPLSRKLRDKALPNLDVRPALANHKGRSTTKNPREATSGAAVNDMEIRIAIAIGRNNEVGFSVFLKLRP